MTLNEGLSYLMNSDPYNNGLIHETWTDKFIQVSYETKSEGNIDGIIDTAKPMIRVVSKIGDYGDYAEDKFERKSFKDIKNYGWMVVGPEYIGKMYSSVARTKSVSNSIGQSERPYVWEITSESILYRGYQISISDDDLLKALRQYLSKLDNESDMYLLGNYVLSMDNLEIHNLYDGSLESFAIREFDEGNHITKFHINAGNIILREAQYLLGIGSLTNDMYKVYKRLKGFGLSPDDIKEFERIIDDNGLNIPKKYLKALDSFERNAAVEMVNKLIQTYLES